MGRSHATQIWPVPWPYHVTWQFCFGSVPSRIFWRMPGSRSSDWLMSCSSSLADRPEIAAAAVLLQEGVEGGEQLRHDAKPMPRPAGKSTGAEQARRGRLKV